MNLFGIGKIVETVGNIADDLITTDQEKREIDLESKRIDADLIKGQHQINIAEAQHKSVFVAGWRPAIGWVGATAIAYQFILYPILNWIMSVLVATGHLQNGFEPPVLEAGALWPIMTGMLGVAGMRSFDKTKKTQTDKIRGK